MGTGWAKPKSRNDALRGDGTQQMKAFVPTQPRTPADIALACQPPGTTPLGSADGYPRTIQQFIRTLLCLHESHQEQPKGDDGIARGTHEPIALLWLRQVRKSRAQVPLGIAVKATLTLEVAPLAKHGQRYDLAAAQRGLRSRAGRLSWLF
jgi:hypothetical protein